MEVIFYKPRLGLDGPREGCATTLARGVRGAARFGRALARSVQGLSRSVRGSTASVQALSRFAHTCAASGGDLGRICTRLGACRTRILAVPTNPSQGCDQLRSAMRMMRARRSLNGLERDAPATDDRGSKQVLVRDIHFQNWPWISGIGRDGRKKT